MENEAGVEVFERRVTGLVRDKSCASAAVLRWCMAECRDMMLNVVLLIETAHYASRATV